MQDAASETKYVICNGDEGDPGAFMDRMLLESFPYRVIEGMLIAARAVGARQGYFYIRAEYPEAVKRINEAIRCCQEHGYLGESILGHDFHFDLAVKQGAGAFVCGEETALINSLEGLRGTPRLRPPFPAESGLWGRPTLINNVETFSLVPWIFRNGAAAFASMGTKTSKGTKLFALAGKIARGGLIEVPMGVTVRQIVEEIGGGVAGGRAVQSGPDWWSLRRLCSRRAGGHADRLRSVDRGGSDHGERRPGRAGRYRLHGRHCPLFLAFHPGSILREVHLLSDRNQADAGYPGPHLYGEGSARRSGSAGTAGPVWCVPAASADWARPRPIPCSPRYDISGTSTRRIWRDAARPANVGTWSVTKSTMPVSAARSVRRSCPVDAIPFTPYQKHRLTIEKCTRCDSCRDRLSRSQRSW